MNDGSGDHLVSQESELTKMTLKYSCSLVLLVCIWTFTLSLFICFFRFSFYVDKLAGWVAY